MRRLFSTFAHGPPGVGLLLMRLSAGMGMVVQGVMDSGGGNAGGGRGAVECLYVRTSVALDHAGNPGRRPGTDRAGRVVYRRTPLWLEATRDSRSKESGLAALMSEFSHP